MRFSGYLAGLLAGAAMFCLAPKAQAEFLLNIRDGSQGVTVRYSDATNSTTVTPTGGATVGSATASTNFIDLTATVDGYNFHVQGTRSQDSQSAKVTFNALSITPVDASTPARQFSYFVTGDPMTQPGGVGSKVVLSSAIFRPSDAVFVGQDAATATGKYQEPGQSSILTPQVHVNRVIAAQSASTLPFTRNSPTYSLTDFGGILDVSGAPNANLRFYSQAVLSLPEPDGVLIGILGLPCMGLVVFFARRRLPWPL